MAETIIVIPPAAPGSTPVQPGITVNCSPAELIQLLRDLGQLPPAPVIELAPAPLTATQRFMVLVEASYWWFVRLLRGIYNLAILLILCMLAAMAMGWLPGITLPSSFSFSSPPAITAPVRSSGTSLSEKLDALGAQVAELKGEVDGIKVQPQVEAPPAPIVEQAPPAPVVQPAPVKKGWHPFAKPATQASTP